MLLTGEFGWRVGGGGGGGGRSADLQVTLVRVPDPDAILVELLHHRHGDQGEGGIHVGVLRVHQDSHLVDARLRDIISTSLTL